MFKLLNNILNPTRQNLVDFGGLKSLFSFLYMGFLRRSFGTLRNIKKYFYILKYTLINLAANFCIWLTFFHSFIQFNWKLSEKLNKNEYFFKNKKIHWLQVSTVNYWEINHITSKCQMDFLEKTCRSKMDTKWTASLKLA